MVGDKNRAGSFDHDSHFDPRVEGNPLTCEFLFALLQNGIGASKLLDAGDHGIHDTNVVDGGRAKNCPQLSLEDRWILEAEANGSAAEKRIFLLPCLQAGSHLVAADIKCANDDAMRQSLLGSAAVVFELFLLAWGSCSVQIKKFRPE